MTVPAITRGTTRYLNGLTDKVVSASICSVTPHGSDLGGDGGPDTACYHQSGQNRGQLPRDGQDHNPGNRAFGIKAGEAGIALQRQHHAGKKRRHPDHGQGVITDIDKLPQRQARIPWRGKTMPQRPPGKNGQRAQALKEM